MPRKATSRQRSTSSAVIILKYIEKNWNLGSLGTSNRRANSIIDVFDYPKGPRPFKHIASSLSKTYFLREQQSYLPVDTDL